MMFNTSPTCNNKTNNTSHLKSLNTKEIQIYANGRSVLLVEETGVPEENHQPTVSHCQTLSHNVASSTPRLSGIRTHNISDDRH